ncbi:hypothetical protein U1Q18_032068, partial [Sarracenia purpurea var. burkii]
MMYSDTNARMNKNAYFSQVGQFLKHDDDDIKPLYSRKLREGFRLLKGRGGRGGRGVGRASKTSSDPLMAPGPSPVGEPTKDSIDTITRLFALGAFAFV